MYVCAIKNNCTCNSQNCTWLCVVQLLDCYSYNYSLIAHKYMRLPIHSRKIKLLSDCYSHQDCTVLDEQEQSCTDIDPARGN